MSKRKKWERIVREYESGDATQKVIAERFGVSLYALRYWINKFRTERRAVELSGGDGGGDGDGDDARMLPVEVVGGDPMDWTTVTIHLDDLSICSEVGTDPDYVASLVAALRAC